MVMDRVPVETDRSPFWPVATSLLLHLLLLAIVLFRAAPAPIPIPDDDRIAVVMVSAVPSSAKDKRAQPPQIEVSKTAKAVSAGQQQSTDSDRKCVKPTQMLSQEVLADRRSSQTRAALSQLAPAEQVEQLCNLEAMAQVGQWNRRLQPDRLVAYAMGDTAFSENSFVADGAAVHSEQAWYRLHYRCDLSFDHKKVVAFEFVMGDAIPKSDWSEHNLPDESGSLD
jgi:hypothetical protein